MTENTNMVLIGGGYAGVMATNRLTQRDDVVEGDFIRSIRNVANPDELAHSPPTSGQEQRSRA
jgi:NADH dehydrogenase FAD-containing subunit